jgi:nitrite reductase (NO-forming)
VTAPCRSDPGCMSNQSMHDMATETTLPQFEDHPVLDHEPEIPLGGRGGPPPRRPTTEGSDDIPGGFFQIAGIIGFFAGIVALVAVIAWIAIDGSDSSGQTTTITKTVAAKSGATALPPAPTLAQAKGIAFEKFTKVDPTLPAVPAGAVKKFTVDVDQHMVQVDPALAPVQAWTYTVNGKGYKGTANSTPIVVNQGDKVQVTFVNGSTKAMHVDMAHSIDFHSAEVAPSKYYVDIAPGKKEVISFVAKHPGVFMYHCATQPILMHTGAGMMGMMVVKPKNMAPVDRELYLTQGEAYIGKPGGLSDMDKLNAKKPDVVMFNGYANQYKANPITVKKGERIRMYVLNAGPSLWSAFHVIGTIFDTTHVEGVVGHDSQTVNLAPSQGGWVEFTLDQVGNYPFVTHSFGDMVKGAAGMLHTEGAPLPKAPAAAATPAAAVKADVGITLGDMWIKSTLSSFKAGKVSFGIKNTGATGHGFAIVKAPAKLESGMVDHHSMLATGKVLSGGQSETVSATLTAGKYELICHVPGHYMAGQHIPFTVTG